MKNLYNELITGIKTDCSFVRFIDIDNGQLEEENPPVSYPCVLIALDKQIRFERTSSRSELAYINASFKVAFQNHITSDNLTELALRNKAVAYWQLLKEISDAIMKIKGSTRKAISREPRADIDVFNIQFVIAKHNIEI